MVFDLDGTLVDSMGAFADFAATVMAARYGMEFSRAREKYQETSGNPFPQQLRLIFGEDARHEDAVAEFNARKAAVYDAMPFFEDVVPALQAMKNQGLSLCVSSNNDVSNVCGKLQTLPVPLDLILGFKPPEFTKGEAHFAHIQKELEVAREQILFVGDSLHDARLAHGCGVRFVARVGTFPRAAFTSLGAASVADLSEILLELQGDGTCR